MARCSSGTATQLPMLFIVSDVTLNVGSTTGADEVAGRGRKAPGVKCERCWRFVPSVRTEPEWAGICDRCVEALAEPANADVTCLPANSASGSPLVVVVLDQVGQGRSCGQRMELYESITVIPGFFEPDARPQHRRGVRLHERRSISRSRRWSLALRRQTRRSSGWRSTRRRSRRSAADAARAGADHRRRGRQPHRPDRMRLRRRLRRRLLARLALLGVQRRRCRHHVGVALMILDMLGWDTACIQSCLARPDHRLFVRRAAGRLVPARAAARDVAREAWGLDANRVLDLGIYIIIAALVGAKLLLLVVDFDQFRRSPAELLSLARSGGVFYGGLILAVAVAFWYIAGIACRSGRPATCLRRASRSGTSPGGSDASPPAAATASRPTCRGRSLHEPACGRQRRHAARHPAAPDAALRGRRRAADPGRAARHRAQGPAVSPAGPSGSTCSCTPSRATSSSSTAAIRAARCSACSRRRSSSRWCSAPLSLVMLVWLVADDARGAAARCAAARERQRRPDRAEAQIDSFTVLGRVRRAAARSLPRLGPRRPFALADPAADHRRPRRPRPGPGARSMREAEPARARRRSGQRRPAGRRVGVASRSRGAAARHPLPGR